MKHLNLLLLLIPLLFLSCNRERSWDAEYAVPLVHGTLNMEDLVDDDVLVMESDSSLRLVYTHNLYTLGMDSLVTIPDTTARKTASLENLDLGTRTIQYRYTLGQIARDAGAAGFFILSSHGSSMVIPPFSGINTGAIPLDATHLFESATFVDGTLELSMTNELPVDLENLDFTITNQKSGNTIISDNIALIGAGQTFTRNYSLAGKTIEGNLVARIQNARTPGSNGQPVPIDTTDAVEINITAKDLEVYEATAVWPSQNLIENQQTITYEIENDVALTKMRVKSGTLTVVTASTLQDSLTTYFVMPGAVRNGQILEYRETIPPAPPGDTVYVEHEFDMSGFVVDFTGKNQDTVNSVYTEFYASIDSTGKQVKLSLEDSIFVYYGLIDLVAEYAEGYFGHYAIDFGPSSNKFELLPGLQVDELDLQDAEVALTVTNSLGAGGTIDVDELVALNQNKGQSLQVQSSVLEQPIVIPPAPQANPLQPSVTRVALEPSSSNILEVLELLPDALRYQGEVVINPLPNSRTLDDFFYDTSEITADLEVSLPLTFSAEGLVLQDTIAVDVASSADLEQVQEAVLTLVTNNKFPLEAKLQLYLVDDISGQITDSLLTTNLTVVEAGEINTSNARVWDARETVTQIPLTRQQLDHLISSSYIIAKAKFSSRPASEHITIYEDYFLRLRLMADFTYRFEQ